VRVDVRKALFVGAEESRFRFFFRAQESGLVEFIGSKGGSKRSLPPEIQRIIAARKVLRRLEPTTQEDLADLAEADQIAERILELQHRLDRLEEERRILRQEIGRVEVFGDFNVDDIEWIETQGHRVVQYFFTKKGLEEEVDGLFYVGSHMGLDYYVSIWPERRSLPQFTEMRVEKSAPQLEARRESALMEMRVIESELRSYEKRNTFLHKRMVDLLNAHHLVEAGSSTEPLFDGHLFAVMGWIPTTKWDEVEAICESADVEMERIAKDDDDFEPTCLENEGMSRVGEDLVHIYDAPSTTDRDPSLWVLCAFSLFFAMIVGDAGYGMIILLTTLWMMRKFKPPAGVGKRFMKLCLVLSSSVIVWGIATNSYFGVEIPVTSPIQKVSFVTWLVQKKAGYVIENKGPDYQALIDEHPDWVKYTSALALFDEEGLETKELYADYSNNVMIEIALLIGCLHVILSMLRVIDRNWAGIGWILFIVGAYLWAPSMLGGALSMANFVLGVPPEAATTYGLEILTIGVGLAIVLAVIQKRLSGVGEITQVVQVFADILSYLRLYALGLAGTIMSQTFNMMGAEAGVVFGAIIILLGNVVNLALAIMGGIIHGLRLNFLEWYHWSFEGGGRMLRPLKLMQVK